MDKKKPKLVSAVEAENRGSAAYMFVTAVFALIIVELIHFLIRLEPTMGQPYYQIRFYQALLPQGIGLMGSVYLLFASYRRIVLLFRENQLGRFVTVGLKFSILLAIYVFAFARPNYWVFVIGFTLLMNCAKNVQLYFSLKNNLKKCKREGTASSKWLLSQVKRWVYSTANYGSLICIIGLIVYSPIIQAVESSEVYFLVFRITPDIINWIALLVFFALAGDIYYWSPLQKDRPLFCARRMQKLEQSLERMYKNLENASGSKSK